jgi:hypothetical protein
MPEQPEEAAAVHDVGPLPPYAFLEQPAHTEPATSRWGW